MIEIKKGWTYCGRFVQC